MFSIDVIVLKGVLYDEKDVSTKKKTKKQGTWI